MPEQDLQFMLGKMTGQLDAILSRLDVFTIDQKKLDDRITVVENKLSKAAGVFAVFTMFASAAATYVWKKVVG